MTSTSVFIAVAVAAMLTVAASETRVSGFDCYRTMSECSDECSMECYKVDYCDEKYGPFYACTPNIALILGIVFGFVLLCIVGCCLCCFCCPFCIAAQYMKKRHQPGTVLAAPGEPTPAYNVQYTAPAYAAPQQQQYAPTSYPAGAAPYPQQQYNYPQQQYASNPPPY